MLPNSFETILYFSSVKIYENKPTEQTDRLAENNDRPQIFYKTSEDRRRNENQFRLQDIK